MKKILAIVLSLSMMSFSSVVYASSDAGGIVEDSYDIETMPEAPTLVVYDSCNISYEETPGDSGSLKEVEVTITNNGEEEIQGWSLVYPTSSVIESYSDIEVVIGSGGIHYLSYSAGNEVIEMMDSVTFHLTISCDNSYVTPNEFRLYGCKTASDSEDVNTGISLYSDDLEDLEEGGGSEAGSDVEEVYDVITYNMDTQKYVFDTTEGSEIPDYSKTHTESRNIGNNKANEKSVSPFSIIGNDGRVRETNVTSDPYIRIAALTITWPNGNRAFGTGFMVSERYMLTAAHCVYSLKYNAPAYSIQAYFGRNGASYRYSYYASEVTWCGTYPSGRTWQNDWGVIKFDENVGNRTGWFGVGYMPNNDLLSRKVRVAGYPFDHVVRNSSAPDGYLRYMYRASNPVRTVGKTYLTYYADTYDGQSGSPVYGLNDDYVSGIHHSHNAAGTCNVGRRVNSTIFNFWMQQGYIH
ncbi:MAG TPA: trypsin-like serine protease [Candidatus Blautia intestinigallinarum]|nr:trypsin-like serine protease [Candidatus Blautia intestinigallinarum]